MADLIVRNLEEAVVDRLREEAAREGVSAEEAHRRLLRRTLLEEPGGQCLSFKEYLLEMPDPGDDVVFQRLTDPVREVDL